MSAGLKAAKKIRLQVGRESVLIQKRWTLLLCCFFVLVQGGFTAAAEVTVKILPDTIYPGQAIWVQLVASEKLTEVTGEFLGQQLRFSPAEEGRRWSTLAAVGLKTAPKEHSFSYKGRLPDGAEVNGTRKITVRKKEFPVERITVQKKYVDLSKEDLSRVHREKKRLGELYKKQSPEAMWLAGFTAPVEAERGSPFGLRRFFNGEPRSPHSGADLRAGAGTPVQAPDEGRVVMAANLFFSGNTVILDHGGGLYTLYAHLEDFVIQEGQKVPRGAVLGHVGATGRVTGPHLHWGARLNGVRVDPFSLVELPLRDRDINGETRDREKETRPRAGDSPDQSD